jgi:hypothetical protein
MRTLRTIATAGLLAAAALHAHGQDTHAWLESQGLEAVYTKRYQEFDAVFARTAGAKDAESGQERVVLL